MEEYKDVSEEVRKVLEELGVEYKELDGWFEIEGITRRTTFKLAEEIKEALRKRGIFVPVSVKRRRHILIPKQIRAWAELKLRSGRGFYAGDILACVRDNLYAVKDELRERGYWWDGSAWCKNISPDTFEEEVDRIRKELDEILSKQGIVLREREIPPDYKEALIKHAKRYREASEKGLEKITSMLGEEGHEFEEYVDKGDLKVVAYEPEEPKVVEVYPTKFLERDDWVKINRLLRSIGCRWTKGGGKSHWICVFR